MLSSITSMLPYLQPFSHTLIIEIKSATHTSSYGLAPIQVCLSQVSRLLPFIELLVAFPNLNFTLKNSQCGHMLTYDVISCLSWATCPKLLLVEGDRANIVRRRREKRQRKKARNITGYQRRLPPHSTTILSANDAFAECLAVSVAHDAAQL